MYKILACFLLLSNMNSMIFAKESDFSKIKVLLDEQIKNEYQAGIASVFIDQNDEQSFYLGYSDLVKKTKVDEHTRFEIGSLTKVFTGVIFASLIQDKILGLDTKVEHVLPELKGSDAGKIKLVDLSTHTSGLPRMPDNFKPSDKLNPYFDYPESKLIEFLKSFKQNSIVPKKSEYSNLGVGLLGIVLSKASGLNYDELLKKYITVPLQMPATNALDERIKTAVGYSPTLNNTSYWLFTNAFVAAGGIVSNISDMKKFLIANMHPEKTKIKEALELAQQVHFGDASQGGMGLGWGIKDFGQGKVYNHNGGTGGFRSTISFNKSLNRAVAYLNNSSNEIPCVSKIFVGKESCTIGIHNLNEEQINKYVGIYEHKEAKFAIEILKKPNRIMYKFLNQIDEGDLIYDSNHKFKILELATIEFDFKEDQVRAAALTFEQGKTKIKLMRQQK